MNDRSQKSSGGNKKTSSQRNRRRKNPNKKQGSGTHKSSGGKGPQHSSGSGQNKRRNQNRNRRRRRGHAPLPLEEKVLRKRDHLLEILGNTRRKYFELFFRADPKQKSKLYHNYSKALSEYHRFENSLTEEEREAFLKRKTNMTLDLTYTQNHQLKPVGEEVSFVGDFPDPHYLASQEEVDFSSDTEESTGSIEDYLKYKES